MSETVDLSRYQARYQHDGGLDKALYVVGDNAEFENWSQPAFMQIMGLRPHHRFLDFGCGCLRGTARLVDYLNEGNFFGTDVSEGLLMEGENRLAQLEIVKRPRLEVLKDYDLKKLFHEKFDFILSVSVLTHILPDNIKSVFSGIRSVLTEDGIWYFTIYPAFPENYLGDIEMMRYRKSYLIELGAQCGLNISDIVGDFPNPCPSRTLIKRVNTPILGQWVMQATLA